MKTWAVAYKDKDFNSDMAVVVAPTYTMAIVEFMGKYPNCEFIGVAEASENESAFA